VRRRRPAFCPPSFAEGSLGWVAALAAFGCNSSSSPAPAPLPDYAECSQGQCADAGCFQFKASGGQIIGALCTTACANDVDCADGGACISFAQASKFCLLPCPSAGCPTGTSCKAKFDGTRDVCFPP
jgi:hypothetical protein